MQLYKNIILKPSEIIGFKIIHFIKTIPTSMKYVKKTHRLPQTSATSSGTPTKEFSNTINHNS